MRRAYLFLLLGLACAIAGWEAMDKLHPDLAIGGALAAVAWVGMALAEWQGIKVPKE